MVKIERIANLRPYLRSHWRNPKTIGETNTNTSKEIVVSNTATTNNKHSLLSSQINTTSHQKPIYLSKRLPETSCQDLNKKIIKHTKRQKN